MVRINMWQEREEENLFVPSNQYKYNLPFKNGYKLKELKENESKEDVQKVWEELDNLIGLQEIKKLINELYAYVEIQKRRQKENLLNEQQSLHMIFKGNPGTGKTTVARIMGKLFKAIGVLPKGHLVEVERADLVGEYIGHTAQKTKDMLKRARGGIMFIDEAYSLARGGEKDFGKESIDALVKGMEDHKDFLVVILAGYQEEMEYFIQTNPGLRSRFPIQLAFPDYTGDELIDIAYQMLEKKQYKLNIPAAEELNRLINLEAKTHKHSGNGRLVRNLLEKAIRQQAVRLMDLEQTNRNDLLIITKEDIIKAWQKS